MGSVLVDVARLTVDDERPFPPLFGRGFDPQSGQKVKGAQLPRATTYNRIGRSAASLKAKGKGLLAWCDIHSSPARLVGALIPAEALAQGATTGVEPEAIPNGACPERRHAYH